jgi:hypothetical protein
MNCQTKNCENYIPLNAQPEKKLPCKKWYSCKQHYCHPDTCKKFIPLNAETPANAKDSREESPISRDHESSSGNISQDLQETSNKEKIICAVCDEAIKKNQLTDVKWERMLDKYICRDCSRIIALKVISEY